jgi:hypothetical protein
VTAAGRQPLRVPPEPPGYRPKVLEPVLAPPDLEPVHDKAEASSTADGKHREQGEMERRRLHDVVARPMSSEVVCDAKGEPDLRSDASPSFGVELQVAGDGYDVDARNAGSGRGIPLSKR